MRTRHYPAMVVATGLLFASTACSGPAEQPPGEQPPASMLPCAEFLPEDGDLSTPMELTPNRIGAMDAFIVEVLTDASPVTNCKWSFGDHPVDFTAAWLTTKQLEPLQAGWREVYRSDLDQGATLSSFGQGARQEVHLNGRYFVTATAVSGSFMPRLVQGAAERLAAATSQQPSNKDG
jgi:hypothetical protein